MKRVRCSARSCLLDSLEEEFLADMAEGWFVLELGFGSHLGGSKYPKVSYS